MTQWRQSCLWEDLREFFFGLSSNPVVCAAPQCWLTGPVTPWSHHSVPRPGCGWRDAALSSAAWRSQIFQHRWKEKRLLFNARQKRKLPVHNCCSICIVCFRHLKLVKLLGEERDQWLCHLAPFWLMMRSQELQRSWAELTLRSHWVSRQFSALICCHSRETAEPWEEHSVPQCCLAGPCSSGPCPVLSWALNLPCPSLLRS